MVFPGIYSMDTAYAQKRFGKCWIMRLSWLRMQVLLIEARPICPDASCPILRTWNS